MAKQHNEEISLEDRLNKRSQKREELIKKRKGTVRESCYTKMQCSTGVYPVDKALYGGVPFGRMIEIYGDNSSGKTTLATIILSQVNKINYETGELDLTYSNPCSTLFVDMEDTSDAEWEKKLGYHRELYGNNVDYVAGGDVACDVVKDFINDDLYSAIVIDCTDQFYPLDVLEAEIATNDLGMRARTLYKACRKWQTALAMSQYRNKNCPWRVPFIIFLSHGTPIFMDTFGRWESTAGKAVRFYSTIRIFMSKFKVENDNSASHGIGKMNALVVKNKIGTAGHNAPYEIALKDLDKLKMGQIDNVKPIFKDMGDWGIVEKIKGSKVKVFGEEYPTQKAFKEKMYSDPEFQAKIWRDMTEIVSTGKVKLEIDENFEEIEDAKPDSDE